MMLNGKTDVGKRRRNNQDSFVIEHYDNASLALVCDGMGGANGGNIASKAACEAFVGVVESFLNENREKTVTEGDYSSMLAHAAAAANNTVFRRAESDKALKGMGTTLVCALIAKEADTLYAVNVGDSRLYFYKGGKLRQITHDHSLVQYLQDTGRLTAEEAKTYPNRNVITRAIGIERTVDADIFSVDRVSSVSDALFLLCSDGLCGYVEEEEISAVLQKALDAPVYDGDAAVEELISMANAAGGADNVTAILIHPTAGDENAEKNADGKCADGRCADGRCADGDAADSKDSDGKEAAENGAAVKDSDAVKDDEAVKDSEAAKDGEAVMDGEAEKDGEAAKDNEAANDEEAVKDSAAVGAEQGGGADDSADKM